MQNEIGYLIRFDENSIRAAPSMAAMTATPPSRNNDREIKRTKPIQHERRGNQQAGRP